jgi:cell division septation protein DedD
VAAIIEPDFFDVAPEDNREDIEFEAIAPVGEEQSEPEQESYHQAYQPEFIEQESEPDEAYYEDDDTMMQMAPDTGPLEAPPFYYEEPYVQPQDSEQAAQEHGYDEQEQAYAMAPANEGAAPPQAESADPWEDALPAWDYSRNEWPIAHDDPGPSIWTRLRMPLIIIVGLASVIAIYFFLYPRLTGDGQSQEPPVTQASGEATTAPVESNPAPPEPATGASTVENATSVTAPSPNPDAGQAEGAYALQVAALPDEASAREFSERLMRAGVSTYVVPVKSGRRKFFRVRVGRFKTAEDAERYAAQSRLRARAAGMRVDFLVVDYSNP